MFSTIPSIPFDRGELEEIIQDINNISPDIREKIKTSINNIEASILTINNNTSLSAEKRGLIKSELKKIRDNAEDIYSKTRYLDFSLSNTLRNVVFSWIKSCEDALAELPDPDNKQFMQNIEYLYEKQKKTELTYALKNNLKKIQELFSDTTKSSIRCYIVHAKPTFENTAREKQVQPFLLKLYEHLTTAGIRVVMDIKDLGPGENFVQFMSKYGDDNDIILVGTKSLNDSHYSFASTPIQSALATVINKFDRNERLIYPLLINGYFKTAFPEPFHRLESRAYENEDYLEILKHLLSFLYKSHMHDKKQQYDTLWEQFHTNPNPGSGISLFDAIKTGDYQALLNVATLDNLNEKYDLSQEEIEYMKRKLSLRRGTVTDDSLFKGLTPLFLAVLYGNAPAYRYLINRGANVMAKTASGTNLAAFMRVFSNSSQDYLILEDKYYDLYAGRLNVPVTFEESKPKFMPQPPKPTVPPVFFQPEKNYSLLHIFISCCKEGDLHGIIKCVGIGTHKQDREGSGLYEALVLGHEECVKKLIEAGVTIKPKHYFAAGFIPKEKKEKTQKEATSLYYVLNPKKESQESKPPVQYPEVVLRGNLSQIKAFFESSNLDEQTKANYLYKLLSLGNLLAVRYVLTTLTEPVAPRHYFAAALNKDRVTANLMHHMLRYYTYKVITPNLASDMPYEILGIELETNCCAHEFVVKRAFRRLALQYHADKSGMDNEEIMKKINGAKDKIGEGKAMKEIAMAFTSTENEEYDNALKEQSSLSI